MGIELRPYQQAAVDAVLHEWDIGHNKTYSSCRPVAVRRFVLQRLPNLKYESAIEF